VTFRNKIAKRKQEEISAHFEHGILFVSGVIYKAVTEFYWQLWMQQEKLFLYPTQWWEVI